MSLRTTKIAAVVAALAVLLVSTAAPQPASAQRLERLEIEARTVGEVAAADERATERALARIEDEFAISDTGIKLLTGESFGQLSPQLLGRELRAAREAVGELSDSDYMAIFVEQCTRGLAGQAPEPLLQRRQRTGPPEELDSHAPQRRRHVEPGHPPAPEHQEGTQRHEDHEPGVGRRHQVRQHAVDHAAPLPGEETIARHATSVDSGPSHRGAEP